METSLFRETIIDTLYNDPDYDDLSIELRDIIMKSEFNSQKSCEFIRKKGRWNVYAEDIVIRVPAELLRLARDYEEEIIELVEYIYEETDKYALREVIIKPKHGSSEALSIEDRRNVFFEKHKKKYFIRLARLNLQYGFVLLGCLIRIY